MPSAFSPLDRAGLAFHIGVTGHVGGHPAMVAHGSNIAHALETLFTLVDTTVADAPVPLDGPRIIRLYSLLADGADLTATELAHAHGWALAAPLPFGTQLNAAINARPPSGTQARAILCGEAIADDPALARRLARLVDAQARARLFTLADRDAEIAPLLLAALDSPHDGDAASRLALELGRQVSLAGRVMIEQSDLLVAIWDGVTPGRIGGTRHTMLTALQLGVPVLWINAGAPTEWRLLTTPEALACAPVLPSESDVVDRLRALIRAAVLPIRQGDSALASEDLMAVLAERWHVRSNPLFQAYRLIENGFGGGGALSQRYEHPEAIASGSAAGLVTACAALPGADPAFVAQLKEAVLPAFAWADGISAYLSDAYRGGMVVNFLLGAATVIMGVSYLPMVEAEWKWPFALAEFGLLVGIVQITRIGRRRRWHERWFETRRLAEYLRQTPHLLTVGVLRAAGQWPQGSGARWPEWYVLRLLRQMGLPEVEVTPAYLRAALAEILRPHVTAQRDYHHAKALRLTRTHRNLDRASERLFQAAIAAVSLYLMLRLVGVFVPVLGELSHATSRLFTFLGVFFPTLGGAIAGIRYFGDFERFAAISEVTAQKLDHIDQRIALLLADARVTVSYGVVSELAHEIDETVVSEIENWQAVFGGKQITVPV